MTISWISIFRTSTQSFKYLIDERQNSGSDRWSNRNELRRSCSGSWRSFTTSIAITALVRRTRQTRGRGGRCQSRHNRACLENVEEERMRKRRPILVSILPTHLFGGRGDRGGDQPRLFGGGSDGKLLQSRGLARSQLICVDLAVVSVKDKSWVLVLYIWMFAAPCRTCTTLQSPFHFHRFLFFTVSSRLLPLLFRCFLSRRFLSFGSPFSYLWTSRPALWCGMYHLRILDQDS